MCRFRRELSSIYLQNLASLQARTSLVKFARSPRTDIPGQREKRLLRAAPPRNRRASVRRGLLKPVSRLLRRTNPSNCMLDPKAHGRLRYFNRRRNTRMRSSFLTISADLFAHREVVSSNTLVFHFSGETELLKRARVDIEGVVYTIRFCRFYLGLVG